MNALEYVKGAMIEAENICEMDERIEATRERLNKFEEAEKKLSTEPEQDIYSPVYVGAPIVVCIASFIVWDWWAIFKYPAIFFFVLAGGSYVALTFRSKKRRVKNEKNKRAEYTKLLEQEKPSIQALEELEADRHDRYAYDYIQAFSEIPARYMYLNTLRMLYSYLDEKRVETLPQALDRYDAYEAQQQQIKEEREHRINMEILAEEQAEYAKAQAKAAKDAADSTARHEKDMYYEQKRTRKALESIDDHNSYYNSSNKYDG